MTLMSSLGRSNPNSSNNNTSAATTTLLVVTIVAATTSAVVAAAVTLFVFLKLEKKVEGQKTTKTKTKTKKNDPDTLERFMELKIKVSTKSFSGTTFQQYEFMIHGQQYNCMDPLLVELRQLCRSLIKKYNYSYNNNNNNNIK
mmetsp:Transcript_29004/g.33234  ORF Transcript_29004/g.33234 Transcript_29004/m.33234 type:complete len:143 (+) Transcript_29004:87-515(+)